MATNHSHELAPSRYPINREISDRRNRERKNLTGNANWSLVVCDGILQAWYFTSTGRRPRPLNGVDRDYKRKRKDFRTKEEEREKMEKNEETR